MKRRSGCYPLIHSSQLLLAMVPLLLLALLAVSMRTAHAGTPITVNDSSGGTGGPGCKLRDAIKAANTDAVAGGCPAGTPGADTITLPASATITLTNPDNGSDVEINGLPAITSEIAIDGNNAVIERSTAAGTPAFRIFYVQATGTLTLNNITVRNGKTSVAFGGSGYGGGIESLGTLVVNNSTISGNSTSNAPSPNGAGWGGGIMGEAGTVMVVNSTISGNTTGTVPGGYASNGGGIATGNAVLTVTNSTISGNVAPGTGSSGGGIYVLFPSASSVTNSTITGNTALVGGGIYAGGSTLTLRNTIVAMNLAVTGENCYGWILNGGNNLDSGTSCLWGTTNRSLSQTNPLLGPLADNGGPTWTHALLAGSPAIDAVTYNAPNGSPSTDQRGIARPQGSHHDIGAFELEPTAPPEPTATPEAIKVFLPALLRDH